MKTLLMGLLLLAGSACTTRSTVIPAEGPATVGPRAALNAFLGAIKAQDLQALSSAWGDRDGPIRENTKVTRGELEQRELILVRCFAHDRFTVLGDALAAQGERVMTVELQRDAKEGTIRRTTNFFLAKAPDRWYVRSADMEPVRDLCQQKR